MVRTSFISRHDVIQSSQGWSKPAFSHQVLDKQESQCSIEIRLAHKETKHWDLVESMVIVIDLIYHFNKSANLHTSPTRACAQLSAPHRPKQRNNRGGWWVKKGSKHIWTLPSRKVQDHFLGKIFHSICRRKNGHFGPKLSLFISFFPVWMAQNGAKPCNRGLKTGWTGTKAAKMCLFYTTRGFRVMFGQKKGSKWTQNGLNMPFS